MVHITASALIVAALSIGDVMCSPAHKHMHMHQRAHDKRVDFNKVDYSNIDYSKLNVDWEAAYAAGQTSKNAKSAPTPASAGVFAAQVNDAAASKTPSSAAPSATSKPSGSSAGLLGGLVGLSNDRTSFGDLSTSAYQVGDSAVNNVGVPYGSNVIKVNSIDGYDFTNTFVNTQSEAITVNVWNKVGQKNGDADNRQSGSTDAPKLTTLTFVLGAGESQTIAVMENSNIGWAQACTKIRNSGQFDTSFGEATFLKKGSGYNLSAIPNSAGNKYNMAISSVEAPQCTSDPTQNYWLTETEPIGTSDGSCFIAQSTAHLTTKMGGNM